jgi:DNA invertase Pin-like site-specific DNA recombinase
MILALDGFFRSAEEFVRTVRRLDRYGLPFPCADQSIDIGRTDPIGQHLMTIMAAAAEFPRSLISERSKQASSVPQAQGKDGVGRAPKNDRPATRTATPAIRTQPDAGCRRTGVQSKPLEQTSGSGSQE